jgi:hypothetical protein
LRSTTQNYQYLVNAKDDVQQIIYDPMDADGDIQQGRVLAWCCGGYCTSEEASVPATPPIALSWCHEFVFEAPSVSGMELPVFVDIPYRAMAGQTLSIPVYLKLSATGHTEPGHVQIIDPNEPWDSAESKLDDTAITDTTDWQTVTAEYTATEDKDVLLRIRAINTAGTGTLHWWADPQAYPTPAEIAAAMWNDTTSPDRTLTS